MSDNPADLSANAARQKIASGELSPRALVDACIARIETLDPVVNAVVVRDFERARDAARVAEQAVTDGKLIGPLHGLPVLIKDIQHVAGLPTAMGSPALESAIAERDAPLVARIRRAGGIILGKTNVPELSIGANTVNPLFGATGNPWNVELTAGGSSGGSAAALAARMAPLATGSDHGGSLRIPAGLCGAAGYRATPGVVPHEMRTITQTNYSVLGPMARSVADVGLLLSVITERDAVSGRDPMAYPLDHRTFAELPAIDVADLRVGFSADLGGLLVSAAIRRAFEQRIHQIAPRFAVCEAVEVDLSDALEVDWSLRQDVFAVQHAFEHEHWNDDLNPNIRASWDAAMSASVLDIAKARRRQTELYRTFAALYEQYDLIITPTVGVEPFPWRHLNPPSVDDQPVENYMAWLGLTAAITVIGHPALSLPSGLNEIGTPLGLQLIGRAHDDARLLAMGAAIETALSEGPDTAAPVRDLDDLAATPSQCATLGRTLPFEATS